MPRGFLIENIRVLETYKLAASMFFGDESQLAVKVRNGNEAGTVSSLLGEVGERLAEFVSKSGIPSYAKGNKTICQALRQLWFAYELHLKDQKELNEKSTSAYGAATNALLDASKLLGQLFNYDGFESITLPKLIGTDANRPELFRLLDNLHNDSGNTIGFWMAARFLESKLSGHNYLPREKLDSRPEKNLKRCAHTPVLFHNGLKDQGEVLWLQIELNTDFKGMIMPDILSHGLMDVSRLVKPMTAVWKASGLTEEYGCTWRYLSRHPDKGSDFSRVKDECIPYLQGMEGDSIQAAAMITMWAAAGKFPLIDTHERQPVLEWFSLDPQWSPLTLSPYVAITASLDLNDLDTKVAKGHANSLTKLAPVTQGLTKTYAMLDYSGDKRITLFDTIIVCEANKREAEEGLSRQSPTQEGQAIHPPTQDQILGLKVLSECTTLGDALNWMLDINRWGKAYQDWSQVDWESQWGPARDAEQQFLDIDGNPLPDQDSEVGRVNTGSLAYMMRPVGGAVEPDEEEANQSADSKDEDLV